MFGFNECRQYCLAQLSSREDFPFGPDTYVYKTGDKIFAILAEENGIARVNLKAEPTEALMLRQLFPAITPGYHMNKQHWNTVVLDDSVPVGELQRQIDMSWQLVQRSLPKSKQVKPKGSELE